MTDVPRLAKRLRNLARQASDLMREHPLIGLRAILAVVDRHEEKKGREIPA